MLIGCGARCTAACFGSASDAVESGGGDAEDEGIVGWIEVEIALITSAYVSIRQHTAAYGSIRQHTALITALLSMCPHTSLSVLMLYVSSYY